MEITKIRLHLVKEPPDARALRGEQAAPVLEAAMGPTRDGAQDVEIGEQRLGGRGVGSHGGARSVVGHPQHEQGVGEHELT